MSRSTIIAFVCLLLIGAAVGWMVLRPESPSAQARRAAGRRKCTVCGHEWYKDRGELIREAKNSADGSGFNKCPECGAWRGVSVVDCPNPECGKPYAAIAITQDEDGNVLSTGKQRACPYCGYVRGSELSGDNGEPAETE